MAAYTGINELKDCLNVNNFIDCTPSNQFDLLCMHINIRSILKNFSALEQMIFLSKKCIDIVILTEVNIFESTSCLYHINGYRMFTALRKNRRGGGIILYVNNKHKCSITNVKTKHFENIVCTVTTQSNYTAGLCAVYRPPSSSKILFIDELQTALEKFTKTTDLYLLGDTNIDLKSDNPVNHRYNNMLHGLGLLCGITEHTRIELCKKQISKSCIDHIYARSRSQDLFSAALGTTLADHRAVIIACTGARVQDVPKYKTCINKQQLIKSLDKIDWEESYNIKCPITLYNYMYTQFKECYEKSEYKIKLKSKSSRSSNDWINQKIIKACEYRDTLFLKWIKNSNNLVLKHNYNKARNYANILIRKTKNNKIKSQILSNKSNIRQLWQILNQITGRIKNTIDDTIQNSFKKANISCKDIANNFAHTFDKTVKQIIPICSTPLLIKSEYKTPANVSMRLKAADSRSVKKIILSLNKNKAPGIDGIRAIDIKMLCKKIKSVISNLINLCIDTSKYPSILKTGTVRPIHKKGSRSDYNNYRPITILSTIDKIIEKYICKQIYEFYDKNKILTDKQYGFQPKKNTTQLLSAFTDSIHKHLNDKQHVLVVFIDYSKAFDTLRHDRLLECLHDSGIRGKLLDWCEDYLKDRKYIVKVSDATSDTVRITEGTAQGSVLGPLHFLTYVNSLSNILKKCEIYQFADDTCLVAIGRSVEEAQVLLQAEFDLLTKWSHDSGLVLNASKTKLMYISSSQNRSTTLPKLTAHCHECLHKSCSAKVIIPCRCESIDIVDTQKYLGLTIDNRLNWKEHINETCVKLRAILAKFSIIKYKIPHQTLLLLYKSLAESTIAYGLSSYGRTYKTHLDQIYSLQLRLIKTIVPYNIKKKYKNDYHQLFGFCKIIPVHEKVKLSLLTEEFFNENLKKTRIVHENEMKTRSVTKAKLLLPKFKNLHGKRTLQYMIPHLINQLPISLKDTITHKNIKLKLKQHFLQNINIQH